MDRGLCVVGALRAPKPRMHRGDDVGVVRHLARALISHGEASQPRRRSIQVAILWIRRDRSCRRFVV